MIHSELLLYKVRDLDRIFLFFFACCCCCLSHFRRVRPWCPIASALLVEKVIIFPPLNCFCIFVKISWACLHVSYFSIFYSLHWPTCHLSVDTRKSWFLYNKSWNQVDWLFLFFFFKIVSAIPASLLLHISFRIIFSTPIKILLGS